MKREIWMSEEIISDFWKNFALHFSLSDTNLETGKYWKLKFANGKELQRSLSGIYGKYFAYDRRTLPTFTLLSVTVYTERLMLSL